MIKVKVGIDIVMNHGHGKIRSLHEMKMILDQDLRASIVVRQMIQ